MKQETKYISVPELARMLGISRIAVFKRIQKGQIAAQKIGRAYAVSMEFANDLLHGKDTAALSNDRKEEIQEAVKKVVKEYGETLRLLGRE